MGTWKKILLLCAPLLAGGIVFFLLSPSSPPPSPLEANPGAAPKSPPAPLSASPSPLGKKAGKKRKILQGPSSPGAIPPGWKPFLGGIRGRIVDSKGSPQPGLDVEVYGDWLPTLLDLAARFFPAPENAGASPPGPMARTQTDKAGRFLLQGVFPGETALLRAAKKETNLLTSLLPQVPGPGELVDLGEIRLPDFASLTGKVVDGDTGEPVEGALVWATSLPGIAAASGLLDLRGGEWILFSVGIENFNGLLHVPGAVRSLRGVMTFPSCRTGKDGTFRLEDVPPGRCALTVSKKGYIPLRRLSLPARPGRQRDMGELSLSRGNEMRILVKDSTGKPVAGAEVLAGAMPPLLPVAVLRPAGKTGPDGVLRAKGIPGGRIYLAAARPGEPWTTAGPFSPGENGVVTLEKGTNLRVSCVAKRGDAETPVEPSKVSLTALLDERPLPSHVKIQKGGRIALLNLPKGLFLLRVSAAGYGTLSRLVTIPPQEERESEIKLVFRKTSSLEVFVRDRRGRPVKQARVFPALNLLFEFQEFRPPQFRPVFTDSRGRALLQDLPPGEVPIAVQHPRAGSIIKKAELPARTPLVVILSPGRIEGWVLPPPGPGKDAPKEVLILGQDTPVPLKTARVTPKGTFVFPSVAPGRWQITLHKPFPAGPFESMAFRFGASRGRSFEMTKSIEIHPGETKKVVFRLGEKKSKSGRIHGTLHVRGRSPAGFVVAADGSGERVSSDPTGPNGSYEIPGAPAGALEVQVLCQDPGFEGASRVLARKQVQLPPGGNLRVDFDLSLGSIQGKVLGPGGLPLRGVMVEARKKKRKDPPNLYARSVQAITGPDGAFTLRNVPPGAWEVAIRSENFMSSERPVVQISGPGETARVVLRALPVVSFLVRPRPGPAKGEVYRAYKLFASGSSSKAFVSGFIWGPGDHISVQAPPGDYVMEIWITGTKGRKWIARGRLSVPAKPSGPIPVTLGPREDPAGNLVKFPVSGKLLGKDGKPVGPGKITFTHPGESGRWPSFAFDLDFDLKVAPGGTFKGEIPEGDYQWHAFVKQGKKWINLDSDSMVRIPAGGARDLVLR